MIDQILDVVAQRLDRHLRAVYTLTQAPLVVSPLVHADGSDVEATRNSLALFLVNIVPQTQPRTAAPAARPAHVGTPTPLQVELHVMVASGHGADRYGDGLRMLSTAVTSLHDDPVLTPQNTPNLPAGVRQVTLEMVALSPADLAQTWQSIGRSYAPSALYRVRTQLVGPGYGDAPYPVG